MWYVTVRSFSGSGVFTLTVSQHMANKDLHLQASTHFPATSQVAAGIANVLKQASKRLYAASQGNLFVESWTLNANGNCDQGCDGGVSCDLCFKNICIACGTGSQHPYSEELGCDTGQCTGPYSNWNWTYINGFVDDASNAFGASKVATHELGHKIGGLPDEYDTSGINQCGHTHEAGAERVLWQTNFCNDFNHTYDGTVVSDDPYSNRSLLQQYGFTSWNIGIQSTPDSYDYADFDFGTALGVVTVKNAADPPTPPLAVPWGNTYAASGLAVALLLAGMLMASRRKEDPS